MSLITERFYAAKIPARDGFRVCVVSDLTGVPSSAEVIEIRASDRCKGAAHLLALFDAAKPKRRNRARPSRPARKPSRVLTLDRSGAEVAIFGDIPAFLEGDPRGY